VIVVAAREADIFPVICCVCHGSNIATLGGALFVTGASSSLPIDESEIYSSTHYCGVARVSAVA
jgi:Rieske Fe-S protein